MLWVSINKKRAKEFGEYPNQLYSRSRFGDLLGMWIFRHKTKHLKFVIGMPFILIIQLVITYIIYLSELNLSADVIKEEDLMKIMGYNVMSLPALVIDEKVVSKGKRLSLDEVKSFIINH